MPKLFIAEGGQESVFELLSDEVTIGRGAANSVQVFDNHASKQHAVVRTVHGRLKLVDLESKNGTRVNGHFRNQRLLEHGDTISIGSAVLRFDAADGARAPAAPVARAPARVPMRVPARPVAPVAAAPLHAAPVTAASRAASRRRERDEDYDEDDRSRYGRRSSSGVGMGLLVGGGVLVGIALLFFLLSRSGASKNAAASAKAMKLANQGDHRAAIEVLRREADPTEKDYKGVLTRIADYERVIASQASNVLFEESERFFKYEIHHPYIEQHKNKISDEILADRIRGFLVKYKGMPKAVELEQSKFPPYPELRDLLKRVDTAAMR